MTAMTDHIAPIVARLEILEHFAGTAPAIPAEHYGAIRAVMVDLAECADRRLELIEQRQQLDDLNRKIAGDTKRAVISFAKTLPYVALVGALLWFGQ